MKNVLVLLFLVLSCSSFGQIIRLTGNLMAESEDFQLGEITVYALPDSTLEKGSYMDSSYFSLALNTGDVKEHFILFSIPGYVDKIVDFQVSESDTLFDFGTIQMEKDLELDAVNVMYRRETYRRTMDGIEVNVDGTNLQTLTNLFEVLKASPKIISPDDESIQIVGRGTPLILIDRQAIISNEELKAIPAGQIDRIEIITNPSARYKAQGSANGVIEVYTKNFHFQGYNMTIRGEGGINTKLKPTTGAHLGLSLKKNRFSLSGYLGASYEGAVGVNTYDGITTDESNRSLFSSTDFESGNLWQSYSIKSAYDISRTQRISAGVNGYGGGGNSEYVSITDFSVEEVLQTQSVSTSNSQWRWLNNTAFVNYLIETDTNRSNLEINLNYVNKVGNNFDRSNSTFETVGSGVIQDFDVRNDSRDVPNLGELRVIYEHIFDTSGWVLSGGGSYSMLSNGKRFDRFDYVDSDWVIDPSFSNSYDYQEDNGAAFFEISKRWRKIGVRTGLRAEYTKLDGYSNSLEKQFIDSSYILPFPSASIVYDPTEMVSFTLYYDSGIDRPQFSNYDPFVRVEDSLIIEYGNPYLRPATQQTIGLDVDLFYMYNISVNYNHKKSPISSISFIDDETFLTETTPWNADLEQEINASLSIPFRANWIRGWNSVWASYSKYSFTPVFERQPFYNLTYGIYSYITFMLPRDFSIMNRIHIDKRGGFDSEANTTFSWSIMFMKRYLGGNFQIFANIGEIIPPVIKRTTYSGNYQFYSEVQNSFTSFRIGLFYKFGRLRTDAQIKESTSSQSDRL